jgi:Zn ribbon nucleic-acid-binding protein
MGAAYSNEEMAAAREAAAKQEGERIVAVLNAHIPSITDRVEARGVGPYDEMGDYVGDTRECHCGEIVNGFYEYHAHLLATLGGKAQEPTLLLDMTAGGEDRCPVCNSDNLQMWADDGESNDADWWECSDCGADGAIPSLTDPTKTQNGIYIKGATA